MKTLLFYLFTELIFIGQAKAEPLPFKQAIAPKSGWLIYLLAALALFAILFYLAKKSKGNLLAPSSLGIIDKKRLGAKTSVYVLQYGNEQFLLADNQQSFAFHPIKSLPSSKIEEIGPRA